MDDKTQRERLEQELRFLKESFEADVISNEEYEKGKDRIEKKLKDIKRAEKEQIKEETKKETLEKQEKIQETMDVKTELKEEKKIKLKVIQDETFEEQKQEQFQVTEQKELQKVQEPKIEISEHKKEGKFFKYAVVFVVLSLVIFFSYSFIKEKKPKTTEQTAFAAEAIETPKINVIVLNDRKDCFNCDTQRVLGILESWLGAISVKEIDYNTEKGKELAEEFGARMLPMYILDENITKKPSFKQIRQTIVGKGSSYILSEDAASSAFYFKRDNIPNKLDLFVIPADKSSISAEMNLKGFLENFKEVKFERHLRDDSLTQELGIKTFPVFLVNNRIKFSGVQSAATIKDNFCKLNKLKECEKNLSKSLI